jgi:aspartate carbamoyltransferase catalytic subunit
VTFAHRTHDAPSAPAILVEGQGPDRKHLLGLVGLSRTAILDLLRAAERFVAVSDRPIKQVPALRGRTVVTLFLEPSTRTRAGFDLAAQRLSADLV